MSEAANQRLFEAASAGDLAAVSAALAEGAELEAKDVVDMTALTIATRGGHLPVIRFLLDQGAQVTHDTIYVASKSVYSNLWIVKLLQLAQIKQVRPSTSPNSEADARLLEAAYAGDIPGLQEAVQAGAKVSASDGQDTAALRWAARRGQAEAVRFLLEMGADVNQASYTGWTALMEAVIAGSEEIVALLIDAGADVNARTFASASVLYFAKDIIYFAADQAAAGRIVVQLEQHGAQYNAPEPDDD
ncbi:MAG: ankyrin repeat domain-containing protein [Chloroflexi bacterium]|nr:ankyrin repeat domain-containing protein [Chloroflexota bacterium]MCI0578008.1 ankyrin repeat domain-containing protein [Chloroflexota bacterium]MCI0646706.1 ankyrin repeat domain-containing protein [Chloroflexota bacterium]MCI0726107.1 ankyrin repeat domain-containing protein [Chloroflexota bacterium]